MRFTSIRNYKPSCFDPPASILIWCIFEDPRSRHIRISPLAQLDAQCISRKLSLLPTDVSMLPPRSDAGTCCAAHVMAENNAYGICGWMLPPNAADAPDVFFLFSMTFSPDDIPADYRHPTRAQNLISSVETLAQTVLMLLRQWRLPLGASHYKLVLKPIVRHLKAFSIRTRLHPGRWCFTS